MDEHNASSQSQIGEQAQKEFEEKFGRPIHDILYDLYIVQNKGNRAISKELGIGSTTVLSWLRALNIPVRPPIPPITPTLFCRQCSKPLTAAQHRAHRHNSETGVYCSRACSDLGRSKELPLAIIIEQYQSGRTVNDIAKEYGTTPDTLRKAFKAAGIPIQRKIPKHWLGKNLPDTTKAKLRDATQRQFADPANRQRAAERTIQQIIDGRTGQAFNNLEKAFANILDSLGITYIWQYRVGAAVFDFYIPQIQTLIECNGTFWHADPRFYSPSSLRATQQRNIANDQRKALIAEKRGYALHLFWEHDILNNPQGVRNQLLTVMGNHS